MAKDPILDWNLPSEKVFPIFRESALNIPRIYIVRTCGDVFLSILSFKYRKIFVTKNWCHISLEPKYEKLNRSRESDFWNFAVFAATRRLSIVSWAIRHQKENDCSACVGDVAIFKTRYSLLFTIKKINFNFHNCWLCLVGKIVKNYFNSITGVSSPAGLLHAKLMINDSEPFCFNSKS